MGRYKDEWEDVTLSCKDSIKGLLKFKTQFYIDDEPRDIMSSGCDYNKITDEILFTYIDLEQLIKDTDFTESQLEVLDLYSSGHTEIEIAELTGVTRQAVCFRLETICEMLVETNHQKWKNCMYWNRVRVKTEYKQCSKCREWLPKTDEYYHKNKSSKDGFRKMCKKCR